MEKSKKIEMRFADLDEKMIERMVSIDPEKWGMKGLLKMTDYFGDSLTVEKRIGGFGVTFDLSPVRPNCSDFIGLPMVTIEYECCDKDTLIDITNYLDYDEFDGVVEYGLAYVNGEQV